MLRPSAGETLRAWLLSALVVHGAVAGNPDAKRLYDDLLSNYNKLVRPVVNTSDVLRVCIKLKLSQLIDVLSSIPELSNGFSEHREKKKKKALKSERDVVSYWCNDSQMTEPDKNEMRFGRLYSYSYENPNEGINSYVNNFVPEDLEEKYEEKSALENGDCKSKLIFNSLKEKSALQKKSNNSYILRSKKKNHKVNRSETFSKRFRNVDSMKEFKNVLESFRIIGDEEFDKSSTDSCTEHKHILPAFFVLKLAPNLEQKSMKKKHNKARTAQSLKLIFEKNEPQNHAVEKLENCLSFPESSTVIQMRDESNQTSDIKDKFVEEINVKDSKFKFYNKKTKKTHKYCPDCMKMEENYKFQSEFNKALLEQVKTIATHLSTMIGLFSDLINFKNEKSNNLKSELIKEFFSRDLYKVRESDDKIISKEDIEKSADLSGTYPLPNNVHNMYLGDGFNRSYDHWNFLQNDFENINKDVCAVFPRRKHKDVFYLPHGESDRVIEKQLGRKNESCDFGVRPKCSYQIKHLCREKKGITKSTKKYEIEYSRKEMLRKDANSSERFGSEEDEKIQRKGLNEKEDEETDYESSGADLEEVCDKTEIVLEDDVKKLERKENTQKHGKMRSLKNDQDGLSLEETSCELNENDAFFFTNEENVSKLSPRASNEPNLKNQIMTTNLWVEQSWYDYKLRWDPKEYGGVHMLHVPSDHIWRPDIVLYNNADGNFEVTLATKATIYHQGLVEWKPPAIYKSSCEIDVEYFPFDEQTCVLKFGSWTYDGFKRVHLKCGRVGSEAVEPLAAIRDRKGRRKTDDFARRFCKSSNANARVSRWACEGFIWNTWGWEYWVAAIAAMSVSSLTGMPAAADGNYEVTLMTKARVSHTGLVEWQPPAVYKSSCAIDVEFFPYDIQTCVLKLGSWTYDGFKVDLRHMDEKAGSNVVEVGVDLSEFYMSVEWDILEVPAVRNEKFYTCCDEPYLDITFNITMRRKTLFYTVNIIIPCMGISFLTVLTFYLPSDSGEKVTLSISILISLHVFFLLVVEIIPPTSLVVPLLGKYLIFAMILVSISICVTVVVLNVHFRSPQTHRMAPWVKRVFIHILPRLLVMRRPQYHFEPHRFMSRRVIMQTVKGKEIQTSYYSYPYQASAPAENPKIRDICSKLPRQRTLSKEDFSPESLADGEPVFGGSCQIHGPPPPQSESEELSLSGTEGGVNDGEDLKSPTINNPAFSHSLCPPEVHKSCFCVRFIAEHTKMLEDSTKVKEDWKYVAMVLDRLFLWIFALAVLVGTAGIILQAPTLYDDRIPIDKQFAEIQTSTVIRCPPQ